MDDKVQFVGPVNSEFKLVGMTISFFFKPQNGGALMDLLSKRETCTNESGFHIRYIPSLRTVEANFSETGGESLTVSGKLKTNRCWHHVVLRRDGDRMALFLDGEIVSQGQSNSTINIENNAVLAIAGGPCLGTSTTPASGLIDELRVYKQALKDDEIIEDLYHPVDELLTSDTLIFKGNSFSAVSSNVCAGTVSWSPNLDISATNVPNPILTPDTSRTYVVTYTDAQGCSRQDSLHVTVVDPALLGCEALVPSAFTPNGDNLNDTYFISNGPGLDELIAFEIFDRWGNRVFVTDDIFGQWDGTFQGVGVNPGIYGYRIRFKCEGKEQIKTGSVTLIK